MTCTDPDDRDYRDTEHGDEGDTPAQDVPVQGEHVIPIRRPGKVDQDKRHDELAGWGWGGGGGGIRWRHIVHRLYVEYESTVIDY